MLKQTRLSIAALAFVTLIPLSGCAALLSPPQTARYDYNGGDGSWGSVNDVKARGVLLIQNAQGDAQFFYTLVNTSNQPQTATVKVAGTSFSATHQLAPGEAFSQNPEAYAVTVEGEIPVEKQRINGLNATVGNLVDVTVTVAGEETLVRTQVLDSSLPEYTDYEPTLTPTAVPADETSLEDTVGGEQPSPSATEPAPATSAP